MIRILKEKTSQMKKLKSGTKKVETEKLEIGGFRVKDEVKIKVWGSFLSVETRKVK